MKNLHISTEALRSLNGTGYVGRPRLRDEVVKFVQSAAGSVKLQAETVVNGISRPQVNVSSIKHQKSTGAKAIYRVRTVSGSAKGQASKPAQGIRLNRTR